MHEKIVFQKQEITIRTTLGNVTIEAMVGVGTGLAYHHEVALGGDQSDLGFVLTHVSTGAGLPCDSVVTEEREAQRWLELTAQATDWNADLQTIGNALKSLDISPQAFVERALDQAVEEVHA